MSVQLWRLDKVMTATGLPRASIYRLIEQGEFPKQIKLAARSVAWPSDEIEKWISDRIEAAKEEQQ